MNRAPGSRHDALGLRPKMVAVDLLTHRRKLLAIDQVRGADGGNRLRERDGRATVQDPERLMRSLIDRHRRDDPLGGDLHDLDAEHTLQAALVESLMPWRVGHRTRRAGRMRTSASIAQRRSADPSLRSG